jgi:proline iminopeptidase
MAPIRISTSRLMPERLARVLAVGTLLLVAACTQLPTKAPALPAGNYVTVNGTRLWYISEGRGEPLLIISGGPGAAHYLYPYFSALADQYRVIYLDSFGSGKSDRAKSPSEYTLAHHVDEIEGLRLALGLGQINLLGHSYGSAVVQAYALKYPGSLKRLVLAGPLISAEAWQQGAANVLQGIQAQYPEIWTRLQALRARGLHETDKEMADAMQEVPEDLLYYANVTNAGRLNVDFNPEVGFALAGSDPDFTVGGELARLDFRPDLKRLAMPMLVMAGRFDRVLPPKGSLQYKEYAPQAQFVMFEKSGHNLFLEENAKMIRTLRAFLGGRPATSP